MKCKKDNECLDLTFHKGLRYYWCWFCGTWYKMVSGEGLVKVEDLTKEFGVE